MRFIKEITPNHPASVGFPMEYKASAARKKMTSFAVISQGSCNLVVDAGARNLPQMSARTNGSPTPRTIFGNSEFETVTPQKPKMTSRQISRRNATSKLNDLITPIFTCQNLSTFMVVYGL